MKKALAVLLALLLTGTLILFCVSFVARQILLPAMSENGAQMDEGVLREEQKLAEQYVRELADLYGFEAEPVIALVTEDVLRDLNSQATQWWSTLLREGKPGEALRWSMGELEQVLKDDRLLNGLANQEHADDLRNAALEDVHIGVIRIALPMRLQTISLGMEKVGERIDIPNLIRFFLDTAWAELALCALLAGLIVLLRSKKFPDAVHYVGGAMGAAAIVVITLAVLFLCAGILPMIQEASAGLVIQYRSVVRGALIRTGILAAAMAAGCFLCMAGKRKSRINA